MSYDPFNLATAPTSEPMSIVIGQSSQWRRVVDVDSALFTLKYVLRHFDPTDQSPVDYQIPMVFVSTSVFAADVEPDDIAGWSSGKYFWDMVISRISDDRTRVIDTGEIHVFGTQDDRRSHAQTMIIKIEALLQGRTDNDLSSYTIKGRSITKIDPMELAEWRDYYLREANGRGAEATKGIFTKPARKTNMLQVRFE